VRADHTMVGGLAGSQRSRGGGRACGGGGAAVDDEPDVAETGEWECHVGGTRCWREGWRGW